MSESLRNDGRIKLPKNGRDPTPEAIPEEERDYFLERMYPTYGNMTPRDVASRRARELCNAGGALALGAVGVPRPHRCHQAEGKGAIAAASAT